jgi:hypothetical protein
LAADPRITQATGAAALDAIVDRIDAGAGAGTIKIFAATIPTDADTAVGAQVLLATLTFSDPAFGNATSASPSVATASAITDDTSADATDTAAWFRIADSNALTVMDGTVGTSGDDINFNTVAFVSGATVSITSLTVSHPLT